MLVLAPTRELAVQIKEEADKFGRSGGIRNTFAPAFCVLDLDVVPFCSSSMFCCFAIVHTWLVQAAASDCIVLYTL
jgi:hypothetical protein